MSRLNYFKPFTHQHSDWENPLTRALLVTLKHSPLAMNMFYDLLRSKYNARSTGSEILPDYSSFNLGDITLDTQIGSLLGYESNFLLSVYITDDLSRNEIFKDEIKI